MLQAIGAESGNRLELLFFQPFIQPSIWCKRSSYGRPGLNLKPNKALAGKTRASESTGHLVFATGVCCLGCSQFDCGVAWRWVALGGLEKVRLDKFITWAI
jgi:hypothetical protein